jgi:hypothetical protein
MINRDELIAFLKWIAEYANYNLEDKVVDEYMEAQEQKNLDKKVVLIATGLPKFVLTSHSPLVYRCGKWKLVVMQHCFRASYQGLHADRDTPRAAVEACVEEWENKADEVTKKAKQARASWEAMK